MELYSRYNHLKIYLELKFAFLFVIAIVPLMKNVLCQISASNGSIEHVNISDNSIDNIQHNYLVGPCLVYGNNICPDSEVTFYLYTRQNPTSAREIFVNDTHSNLQDIGYNPKLPTKVVVHGYNSDMLLYSMVGIREEYLKKIDCNVIAINWSRYASAPCYPFAVYNARHVGKCLAQLIQRIRDKLAEDIHILGFSLGAHVSALAANGIRPNKISRITGLDPAMPLFVAVDNDEKLDADDAEFVDVIHTNALVQGQVERCGHADFYMNGGIRQPGCRGRGNPFGCDHHRAPEYFAESINSKTGFWGWSCTSFIHYLVGYCPPILPAVRAGDDVDKTIRGFFLVNTNPASPFANGSFALDDYQKNHRKLSGFRKKFMRL